MLEEALDGPAARLDDLRQLQVLFHRHAGDDAAVLRHQADADTRRLEGLHLVQRLVVEPDLAMTQVRLSKARNAAQRRSLAGAVAPEQGDDLPLVHIEADVLHDVALAVVGIEAPGGKIRRLDRKSTRLNSSH